MSENEKTEKLEYQTEEKIEGLTEPIEGEKDIESEPAQGETVDGGGSPKRKRRIVAAAVLGVAVIALCIAGIVGAATPSEAPQPEKSQPEQETVAPKNDQKYSLAVKIEAEGWTDTATKATVRVEAAAPHGEMEPIEREVECGENIVLVEADEFVKDATYKVSVSKAPVLEDGSTYTAGEPFELKAPSDAAASASNTVRSLGLEWDNEREDAMVMFETVSADEKKIIVNITLAPKALADMSAEEVEASATALEAAGQTPPRRPCRAPLPHRVMLCKAGGPEVDRRPGEVPRNLLPLLLPLLGPTLRRLLLPSRILRRMSITGFPKRQRRLFTTISVGFAALIFKETKRVI